LPPRLGGSGAPTALWGGGGGGRPLPPPPPPPPPPIGKAVWGDGGDALPPTPLTVALLPTAPADGGGGSDGGGVKSKCVRRWSIVATVAACAEGGGHAVTLAAGGCPDVPPPFNVDHGVGPTRRNGAGGRRRGGTTQGRCGGGSGLSTVGGGAGALVGGRCLAAAICRQVGGVLQRPRRVTAPHPPRHAPTCEVACLPPPQWGRSVACSGRHPPPLPRAAVAAWSLPRRGTPRRAAPRRGAGAAGGRRGQL